MSFAASGNVGIGTATPESPLEVLQTNTDATAESDSTVYAQMTLAPSADQGVGSSDYALDGEISIGTSNAKAIRNAESVLGYTENAGTGAVNYLAGVDGEAVNIGTAAITSLDGGYFEADNSNGTVTGGVTAVDAESYITSGTVATNIGLYIFMEKDGGTITGRYGIYLDAPAGAATSDYGIYQVGAQTNYLNGAVGISAVSPGSKLSVNGNAAFGTYSANAAPANGMIVSGSVGIGTTSPGTNAKLAVNGGAAFGTYGSNATAAPANGLIVGGKVGIGSAAPLVSLDMSQNTDALALPVGTTGQEPASPVNGMIRYNSTLNNLESYINGAWTTLSTGGSSGAVTLGTSVATPSPARSGEATTGLFSPASGDVSITSTGTEIGRFTGTGLAIGTTYISTAAPTNGMIVQGKVGIGTTSPNQLLGIGSTNQLTVDSSGNIVTSGTYTGSTVIGGTAASSTLVLESTSGAGTSDAIIFKSASQAERMRIDTNGMVGIGVTNPSCGGCAKLNVTNAAAGYGIDVNVTANYPSILVTDGSGTQMALGTYLGNGSIYMLGLNDIDFATNNATTSLLRLKSNGNVGISTSAPDAMLSLDGQSARTIDMIRQTTAATAGNNLTVKAGGAYSAGTDLAGGNLLLSSGVSTGTRASNVQFQVYPAAASTGSADNAQTTAITISETGTITGGTGSFGNLATTLQTTAASGTDKNGSTLTLASGVSTGTGSSSMNFNIYKAGSTGSTANSATTVIAITNAGNVGIGTTTPLGIP